MAQVGARVLAIKSSFTFAVTPARVGCNTRLPFGIAILATKAVVLRQFFAVLKYALRTCPVISHSLFVILVEVENPLLYAS